MPRPRPKRPRPRHDKDNDYELAKPKEPPPAAFPRAYEAQLEHGVGKERLIPWAGDESVLADPYDMIHLLNELPEPGPLRRSSGSAWSLPSDTEELFYISGEEEVAAHRAARRRRWVDDLREARLREREREDDDEEKRHAPEPDREPPPDVLSLMTHTARSLGSSPNPAALEMRILTRHAQDARFSFLRKDSPFAMAWTRLRAEHQKIGTAQGTPARANSVSKGAGGISDLVGGYESSESGSRHSGSDYDAPPPPDSPPPWTPPPPPSP